jgi:hypothetical protein
MATHWNYLDAIAGWVTGIQQIQNGQIVAGSANMLSSCQLSICTIIANLAYHTNLVPASAAATVGLMGFSFAACMVIACGIELYEIKKCNKNIAVLSAKLTDDSEKSEDTKATIRKAIQIEKAKKEDHIRAAKSWAGCAIAMTAVAIIAYITLSGLTFGALPAATIAVAAVAVVSGLIRRWWVNRVNNVDLLVTSYGAENRKTNEIKPETKTREGDEEVVDIFVDDDDNSKVTGDKSGPASRASTST